MTPLTEHQFHTVWTAAVGKKGYDKRLFQAVFEELYNTGLISKPKETLLSKIRRFFSQNSNNIKIN